MAKNEKNEAVTAINDNNDLPEPCPICSKPGHSDFKPFCSKRCADVDLHRWLSGNYAIPVLPEEEESTGLEGGEDAE